MRKRFEMLAKLMFSISFLFIKVQIKSDDNELISK